MKTSNCLQLLATTLAITLLLCFCKNGEKSSFTELGYEPDDLEELRKFPEYVPLSEYEALEEDRNAMVTPVEKESEEAVVHIKYTQPINGYEVSVDMYPDAFGEDLEFYGPATLHFKKGNTEFTVEIDDFSEDHFNYETTFQPGQTVKIKPTPLPAGKVISENCTIFFSDVDFDGQKELLVREPFYGTRGTNGYHVYEQDGTERDDVPFYAICDMSEFNASEKSITQHEYYGVILGSNYLKYRRQRDGSFALTDSTHVDYKVDFTDSIRFHYRKQGDKMVLVKKEVLK